MKRMMKKNSDFRFGFWRNLLLIRGKKKSKVRILVVQILCIHRDSRFRALIDHRLSSTSRQ